MNQKTPTATAADADTNARPSPVESVRRLVADGKHNAWTSMARYKGGLYLAFRSGSGHGIADGTISMMRSSDMGQTWEQIESPQDTSRSFGDGHFCECKGRLYFFANTFKREQDGATSDKSTSQQFVSWTDDGENWQTPQPTYDAGWHYWIPTVHDDAIYVAAYRIDYHNLTPDGRIPPQDWYVRLLRTEDGLAWDYVSDISLNEGGNETELYVDEDNVMHAYIRSGMRPEHMRHRTAAAPFNQWSDSEDCGFNCEGHQVRKVNDRLFLAGRHRPSNSRIGTIFEPREGIRTRVWVQERGYWVDYAELPSGADCSYPAMMKLDDERMLMSYYSQHDYVGKEGFADMYGGCDIYLAVIRTDAVADWGQLIPIGRKALEKGEWSLAEVGFV